LTRFQPATLAFGDLDEEFDAAVEVTPSFIDNPRKELFPSQSPLSHGHEGCEPPGQSLGEHPVKPSQSILTHATRTEQAINHLPNAIVGATHE
jgi:hypothetical protein